MPAPSLWQHCCDACSPGALVWERSPGWRPGIPVGSGGSGPGGDLGEGAAFQPESSRAGESAVARRPPDATAAHTATALNGGEGAAPRGPREEARAAKTQRRPLGASRREADPGPGSVQREKFPPSHMTAELLRHSEAIGVRSFCGSRCCWKPWLVTAKRLCREDAYRAPRDRGRSAFATTSPSPWSDWLERARADTGKPIDRSRARPGERPRRRPRAHERVSSPRLEAAATRHRETLTGALRVVADARPRQVVRCSSRARRQPRGGALRGLARGGRGDDDAANNLQARAAAIAERDRASPDPPQGAAVTT